METKQKFDYVLGLKKILGYNQLLTVEPIVLSGDLALMWKDSFHVEVISSDKRLIDLKVKCGSYAFYFTCVYGDPVVGKRQEVWDRLVSIGLNRDEAWVLGGDFNELLSNEEKSGGAVRSESSFCDFRNMVQNCKLKEIRSFGNCLSWCGLRENGWVQCKVYRGFGNDGWFARFPKASVEYLELWASDHRAIVISFAAENEATNKRRFLFDKRMISREGFEDLVRDSWEARSGTQNKTMTGLVGVVEVSCVGRRLQT